MKEKIQPWKTIESKYVLDSKYIKIRQDKVVLPDGTIYDEYYVHDRPGWAAIFCLTEDGKVILNRQYKHGIGQVVLELPAGSIELDDKDTKETIMRELEEETGYQVKNVELIGKFIIDPTFSSGWVWVYFASGGSLTGKQQKDAREIINIELVTPNELLERVRKGEINVQGHVAAIYLTLDKKGLL